ncbi:MAG: sensor histidine kinase [Flavobacteriales bacterium]
MAFLSAIVIFIRLYLIKKRAHEDELKTKEFVHQQEVLKTQVEIQTLTMEQIGREIHDNVGQNLTLSSLYIQQILQNKASKEIHNQIEHVGEIINVALNDLRALSKDLTDDRIENQSLSTLIEQECIKLKGLKICKVVFEDQSTIGIDTYREKSVLLRIIQEFTQNSIKHAQCNEIKISIRNDNGAFLLMLQDDGIGFDVNKLQERGIGLKNIRKRIDLLDGELKLSSSVSKGTCLKIKLNKG